MLRPGAKLVSLSFIANARVYYPEQGKDYPESVEVDAILHPDGETLIITDVSIVEET